MNLDELVIMVDLQNDFAEIMDDDFVNSINKLCKYLKLTKKNFLFIKSHYFELIDEKMNYIKNIDDRLKGTHLGKKICIENTFGSELINLVKI